MKTVLYVVGKTDEPFLETGIQKYLQRIVRYTPFELQVIPDIKNSKALIESIQKEKEGESVLKKVIPGDFLILLDEKGKNYSSMELAQWMEQIFQQSSKRLVFVIGGPYGFSKPVYDRANGLLSLSRMTFSHQLVRLLFLEQLYRCHSIINGDPYHHA
jgi:23S rRNA (pseudouridine1915-N3)-methyltransferase